MAPVTLAAVDSAILALNADDGTIENLTWGVLLVWVGATEWRRSATQQRRDDVRQRESHLSSVHSGFCTVDRVQEPLECADTDLILRPVQCSG